MWKNTPDVPHQIWWKGNLNASSGLEAGCSLKGRKLFLYLFSHTVQASVPQCEDLSPSSDWRLGCLENSFNPGLTPRWPFPSFPLSLNSWVWILEIGLADWVSELTNEWMNEDDSSISHKSKCTIDPQWRFFSKLKTIVTYQLCQQIDPGKRSESWLELGVKVGWNSITHDPPVFSARPWFIEAGLRRLGPITLQSAFLWKMKVQELSKGQSQAWWHFLGWKYLCDLAQEQPGSDLDTNSKHNQAAGVLAPIFLHNHSDLVALPDTHKWSMGCGWLGSLLMDIWGHLLTEKANGKPENCIS